MKLDEFGIDPHLEFQSRRGGSRRNARMYISCYSYGGQLFAERRGTGFPGVNLSKYVPVGTGQSTLFGSKDTNDVVRNGKLKLYPEVFEFANYPYWSGDDTFEVNTNSDGTFKSVASGGDRWKD